MNGKELSNQINTNAQFIAVTPNNSSSSSYGDNHESPLHNYIRVFLNHRNFIALLSAVIVGATIIYSFLATPMYEATATLQIGTYAPLLPGASMENSLLQETSKNDYINTQVQLLNSLKLADEVLSDKNESTGIAKYLEKKTGIFSVFGPFLALVKGSENNIPEISGIEDYQQSYNKLSNNQRLIHVSQVRNTSLVKITAKTSDPLLSAQIANIHSKTFIETARAQRLGQTSENLTFLKSQAQELAEKVAQSERELATYAEDNAIVSLNKDENIVVQKMAELNALLTEATSNRIVSESAFKEAESGSGVTSTVVDDSSIQGLRLAIEKLRAEYAMLSKKFKPNYPNMVQLQARISNLQQDIESQRKQGVGGLEAKYKADVQSEEALSKQLEMQKSKAFELSRREVQYNIMKREFESVKDLRQAVLRQLKEAQMSLKSRGTNVSLSIPAVKPITHSSPKRLLNILIAMIFAPFLGFAIALCLETLDNTLRSPDEVNQELQLASLGVIPAFGAETVSSPQALVGSTRPAPLAINQASNGSNSGSSNIPPIAPDDSMELATWEDPSAMFQEPNSFVLLSAPLSLASESFRSLRTSLLLSSAGNPPKRILITSAKTGEGKTTVSSNLAIALAQSSGKVIIIDADLRKPSVHKRFGIDPTEPGLVDLLVGQNPIQDVIHQSVADGLHIIPAGSIPPNPAELLSSAKMLEIIDLLSEKYDHVLIDSPPILPVTDAVGLSTIVDGVVLVVRGQSTPKRLVQEARNRLSQVGAKILGVVLNDVNINKGSYYHYYKEAYTSYAADEQRLFVNK